MNTDTFVGRLVYVAVGAVDLLLIVLGVYGKQNGGQCNNCHFTTLF